MNIHLKKNTNPSLGIMLLFFLTTIVFSSCQEQSQSKKFDLNQLKWPIITKTTRPWARWWWMGSAVNKQDLSMVMKDYKDHGLGGLELTPIYGVKGAEDQFIQYLSPQWMEMYQYTLDQAQKLNLGIDLDNASSWPFGGPWVEAKDESKTVFHKTYTLKGGQTLQEPVKYQQKGLVSTNGERVSIQNIKRPMSANKDMQQLSLFQVIFPREIPLKALVAYSDKGDVIQLKEKVDSSDHLNWTAPKGNWKIYAVFEGYHGKMVERAAPGGEGFVIDPFSQKALQDYLSHFDSAFEGHDISYTRAFFQDSYEYNDGHGQADWTPSFFKAFKKYKGYDLREHLPALFGDASPEENKRVITDYRATISDLLLNDFTKPWKKWAKQHDAVIRNQAHGSPANILDLYGASDIPETEGYDPIKAKFASSAGHVMNRPLISTESCTWMDEHFLGTLAEAKKTVNLFLLNGINHVFYHGTSYSPQDADWPGWLFYAAVDFNPSNSFWDDFTALNHYIARVQSFLQKGKPDNDFLIYYPIFDYWSDPGSHLLKDFDGGGRGEENSDFFKLANTLSKEGYKFDFISDHQIQKLTTSSNKIQSGDIQYKTILIPESQHIPIETMKKLVTLSKKGATIIIHNTLPTTIPGFKDWKKREEELKEMKDQLHFNTNSQGDIQKAEMGKGQFLKGEEMSTLLSKVHIHREVMVDDSLRFSRRKSSFGNYYFIVNKSTHAIQKWIPLQRAGASIAIFNPQNSKFGMGKIRQKDQQTEVYLHLLPGEAVLLNVFKEKPLNSYEDYPYYQSEAAPQPLKGEWKVDFVKGGPTLPSSSTISQLTSWTNFNTPGVKAFSGTARYTINFAQPKTKADAWKLHLGKVYESARIKLNGSYVDTLIAPPYQVVIPVDSLKGQNTLEIEVSNLMANRIADMDKKGIKWKHFYNVNFPPKFKKDKGENGLFDASNWSPRNSGLVGPVTLQPLKRKKF